MALGVAAFNNARRQTVRAPINPMDKCTLISIFPKDIKEHKITITPSEYYIPAGSYEEPSLLVIGPASWWRDVGPDEPLLEIPHSSTVMADSVIKDFMNGILGCNMTDAMPGVFWLPGNITKTEIKTKYKAELDRWNTIQTRYWQVLVKLADTLWARTNGNPLSIHEDSKLAANQLGLQRDWTMQFVTPEISKCPACGSQRNPAFPICPTCKAVVDPAAFAKMGLKFAE